jgi:hypothetical protein
MNMNLPQTIFTFFYALYFAVTVASTGKLRSFETVSMTKIKYHRVWYRFFYSIFLLDFLPVFYFIYVYNFLGSLQKFHLDFVSVFSVFIVFLLSLAGQGFYRIHFGLMLIKDRDGSYIFYDYDLHEQYDGLPPSN